MEKRIHGFFRRYEGFFRQGLNNDGVAHAAWTATYARDAAPDVAIDFKVHYLVQMPGGEPRIFDWASGDEQALLRRHGIV